MREIKFRAITKEGKIIKNVGKIEFFEDDTIIVNDEIPIEQLVQYTGLKDKTGKEIYEGDILQMQLRGTLVQGVIEYSPPSFYLATDSDLWDLDDYKSTKIIGNIYENPELK